MEKELTEQERRALRIKTDAIKANTHRSQIHLALHGVKIAAT